MRPKFWTPNLRRPNLRRSSSATARLNVSLLLWFTVGLLLPWLVQSFGLNRSNEKQLSFEEALETITGLRESKDGNASAPFGDPQYGITQTVYDAWRRSQNQPFQSVSRISQAEVREIYQSYWQQGNCDRYEAPLDIVCLDSLISFGSKTGQRFLNNLPDDPKEASLVVIRRREALQRSDSNAPGAGQRNSLRQDTKHNQALAELVESYSPSEQSQLSDGLRRWLDSKAVEDTSPDSSDSSDFAEESSGSSPSAKARSSDQIYKQAKPFVVEVWISTTGIVAPASGILLTSDGLVLTNYHVINEATFDFVRSADGQDFEGEVLEVDPSLDLALIQLKGAKNLPTAKLSSSAHVEVGDTVYAIGSPMGSHWKMTEAEVIEINSDCGLASLQCIRTPEGFLKPGNSGGPLLDSAGQVIGINRAIQDGTGEGVSIPSETVKQFVDSAH